MRKLTITSLIILLLSCQADRGDEITTNNIPNKSTKEEVKYAKGFSIVQYNNYKILSIRNAWVGDETTFKYVLYNDEKPLEIDDAVFIKTPINSIACMSLTHLSFIEKIGMEKSIVALSGGDYINSNKIKKLISDKSIHEIGNDQNVNFEMLIDKSPDIIMGFGVDASSNKLINKMNSLGLDVVLNAEYMEVHPLGKAEWIKFVAAFYNKDEEAALIFDKMESEYLSLLKLTEEIKDKPTVFTGMPWNGAWYVPGAASFQVQLFKDAGAQFLWMDNDEKSSLIKSKEIIIDEAYDSDFWLNLDSYRDVKSIVGFDNKFNGFNAVKKRSLYNNDNRLNGSLGNDYWESGVTNPHILLKDLIEIFHPDLLDHQLYYYRKLE